MGYWPDLLIALQWGRALMSTEILRIVRVAGFSRSLQWGRALMSTEIGGDSAHRARHHRFNGAVL